MSNRIKYQLDKIVLKFTGSDGSTKEHEYDPLTYYDTFNLNNKNLQCVDMEGHAEIGTVHFTFWNMTIKEKK